MLAQPLVCDTVAATESISVRCVRSFVDDKHVPCSVGVIASPVIIIIIIIMMMMMIIY